MGTHESLKIEINLENLSPALQNKLFSVIFESLNNNILEIAQDSVYYNPEGEAYKDMAGWKEAAEKESKNIHDLFYLFTHKDNS